MTVKCPICAFVRPLHPHTEMTWCPCGWRQGDPVPEPALTAPVQLTIEVEVEVVVCVAS